jgi:hypothetical protein
MKPRLETVPHRYKRTVSKEDYVYKKSVAQFRTLIKEISEDYGKDWVQNKRDKDLAYRNYKKYKRDRLNKLIELMSLEIDKVPHKGVETIMNGNIV